MPIPEAARKQPPGERSGVVSPRTSAVEYADLFSAARLVVQPGAGHSPWQDDPGAFVRAVAGAG